MATWQEMSLDCRDAAKELILGGRYRSGINRAYYAVYCGVTAKLEGKVTFHYGGNNPSHESLQNLAENNLRLPEERQRWILRRAMRRLLAARVEADYVPTVTVDLATAIDALRDAESVLEILETLR